MAQNFHMSPAVALSNQSVGHARIVEHFQSTVCLSSDSVHYRPSEAAPCVWDETKLCLGLRQQLGVLRRGSILMESLHNSNGQNLRGQDDHPDPQRDPTNDGRTESYSSDGQRSDHIHVEYNCQLDQNKCANANATFSQQNAMQSGPRPLRMGTMNTYKRNAHTNAHANKGTY